MKKSIRFIMRIAVLLTAVGCLSGCFISKSMYDQADADQVTAKGTEMMQEWLADGNEYLSDFAKGYICGEEENTEFMINTVTGAVYFGTDEDTQAKLNAAAEAYIHEIPGVEYFGAN